MTVWVPLRTTRVLSGSIRSAVGFLMPLSTNRFLVLMVVDIMMILCSL